jgi:Flp pilus assembly protein protease CpaA
MPLLLTPNALAIGAVAAATVAAAIIDLRTRRVPNALTMSVACGGVAIAALGIGPIGIGAAISGCLIGLAVMLPGHLIGGTGGGDVKLLASVGTLLGPTATLRAFVATAIAGGVIAVVVALRRRRMGATLAGTTRLVASMGSNATDVEHPRRDNRFAYAPAIAVGAIVAALTQ